MAAWPITSTDPGPVLVGRRYTEPLGGMVVSVILSWISNSIISMFIFQRVAVVDCWRQLPFVQCLVLAIYFDSFLFVFATAVIQFGFNVDFSPAVCDAAILLCLVCYVTTKLIYWFLVEKAYIIRSKGKKARFKSKLYIFNACGMLGVYTIIVVLNFVYRIARIDNDGKCIIGMEQPAMIPLIGFDLLINVYLTILFLIPLTGLYNFRRKLPSGLPNKRLKMIARRTFVGCLCTLTSSVVNLTVLMLLKGEPGWICLMCCNSDILFSAVVVHWITFHDSSTMTRDETRNDLVRSQLQSHTGSQLGLEDADAAGRVLRRKVKPGGGGHDSEEQALPPSRGSRLSRKLGSDATAELDEIALERYSGQGGGETSPCSESTFGSTKDDELGKARTRNPEEAIRPASPVYAPGGKMRQSNHQPQKHSAAEVRVDTNYGASHDEAPTSQRERDASPMGNYVTIDANGNHRKSRPSVLRRASDRGSDS